MNGALRPEQFLPGSNRKVWWNCRRGEGHEWQAVIGKRVLGHRCPFCAGMRVPMARQLAIAFPEIAKTWDYDRNPRRDPYTVAWDSMRMVWWRCRKGHSWRATVYQRTKGGEGCPECTG